ncbi:MAG: thioredoxin family protein [Cryomorphaceae bacterium]|nr:thioredoxin family protein [Cryomorphaceae bacterium]
MLFTCFILNVQAEGINFQKLSTAQALTKAKKENKKVFIDVYAVWCGPCKYLTNSVFIDVALGAYMNEHFVCIKIDGEQGEGEKMMEEFSIDAFPTMLFLDADRKLLKKIVGAYEADELLAKANGVISPETTKLYQLNKRYQQGERDKAFLMDFLIEKSNEGENIGSLLEEYIKLYPTLNLEDPSDFLIFKLSKTDLNDPLVQAFLNEPKKYMELYGDEVFEHVKTIFTTLIEEAKVTNDLERVKNGLEILYPVFQIVLPDDETTKEEILTSVEAYFNQ